MITTNEIITFVAFTIAIFVCGYILFKHTLGEEE
jgi:hypothetical protein